MPGTLITLGEMHLHADKLDTGQRVVDERKMLVLEFPTVHVYALRVRIPVPT